MYFPVRIFFLIKILLLYISWLFFKYLLQLAYMMIIFFSILDLLVIQTYIEAIWILSPKIVTLKVMGSFQINNPRKLLMLKVLCWSETRHDIFDWDYKINI